MQNNVSINIFITYTGCHVDPNCASQTGIEVDDADACCEMRNRRSFRDPNDPDGTCTLCEGGGTSCNCHYSIASYVNSN